MQPHISSGIACFSLITVTGRKEAVERFRNTMENGQFHFDQVPIQQNWMSDVEKWGTLSLIDSYIIEDKPKKIVILCETLETPALRWAEKCEKFFRCKGPPKNRCYITIQTNYYSLMTKTYGIHIVKSAGNGHKYWKLPDKSTNSHFKYFLEQFGFMEPKVQEYFKI